MKIFKTRSTSPAATKRLARALAGVIPPGAYVKLEGGLGAGKTTFVSGFVSRSEVSSPSFILKKTYAVAPRRFAGKNKHPAFGAIHHIDLWRLRSRDDVSGLFEGDSESSVWLIEWADRLPEGFPDPLTTIRVKIRHIPSLSSKLKPAAGDFSSREITMETASPRLAEVLKSINLDK